ncbi:MAG: response regulator [Brevundimonas sp.]|nr:MAG: response regulator [Brevundimonas sp.]
MSVFRFLVLLLGVVALSGVARAEAPIGAPARAPVSVSPASDLVQFVERRASATSFAQLNAFGRAALTRNDREGLNRLYHVTWTIMNQGDFDAAGRWNQSLAAAARRLGDVRYQEIARLNALTIRYDKGETGVAAEMHRTARQSPDWFVRAHAARLAAIDLFAEDKVGAGLQLLTKAQADIPDRDPYADTARDGLWEVVGLGLMTVDDIEGATEAFRKYEIEYSNPAYPRPDFDSIYNLTKMAVRIGDLDNAARFAAAHHRATQQSDVPSLAVYDANLCANVASARDLPRQVLACWAPYGESLGEAAYLAENALPLRARARARTGDVAGARRDLETLKRLGVNGDVGSDTAPAEAEILLAEGRAAEAYRLLRAHTLARDAADARSFSSGIHQITGDMQHQLADRRVQLETAKANTGLQRGIMIIGIVFLLFAIVVLLWQMRQAARLRLAQRKAEDANRAKSEFLANMSHEIRTPLNGVVSMADALARRELGPQEHEMIELIRSSSGTLERLLSDILDSAKVEAGQVTLEPTVFALRDAVNDVAALWRAQAEDKGVALLVDMDPALEGQVEGDVVRLRQVLTNLVSNALKFTSQGSVRLAVSAVAQDRVRFEVHDTGVGFDKAQRERIFHRFQQADGSITRRYGGTGLGLAISSALVELMGGELDCDSVPGEGSTFHFEVDLPRTETAVSRAAPDHDATEVEARPLRILLADDHPANRKVVEIMLAATDMELVAVEDGRQALDTFAGETFDLVLMDMQMPVMDGLSATRAIRALEAAEQRVRTPIVMLTANAMTEHVEAGRTAGADGHLAKPITLQTLMAAMSQALSGDAKRDAA